MTKKSGIFKNFRISYNAPVTLTFSILCVLVLVISYFTGRYSNENEIATTSNLILSFFSTPSHSDFDFHNPLAYFRLILHIFGHANVNHLVSNLAFILLLGPVIEERYGSVVTALMILITSLVTGVLNACFSKVALVGSSDVVFMMILLTSFTNISKSEIPLSFILILILYIGRKLLGHSSSENIATFAHIAGGLCGSLFAFLAVPKSRKNPTLKKTPPQNYPQKKSKQYDDNDNTTVIGSIEV